MSNKQYKSIKEVSELLKIKKHVIRYWDSCFEDVSTRLGKGKRRHFSAENIGKLESLKNLLHTNHKSHHSIEMARKILDKNNAKKNLSFFKSESYTEKNIDKLIKVSTNLKKLIQSI